MSRDTAIPVQYGQYLAARFAAMTLTMFDAEANLRTAAGIGRLMHRFDNRHRERTQSHLRIAFPEKSQREIDRITLASFEHFVQLLVEVLHTPRLIHEDSWANRLGLGNPKLIEAVELANAGKPAINVTGHLGNWEVLGYMMAVLGYRVGAIARPLDNRFISDWLLGIRERKGMRIITKWDATDTMVEVLDAGGTLGFIADQNAGDKGMFVPFFGKLASTYKSIALLALAKEIPVVCGYARRIGDGLRYEIGVADIIYPQDWKPRRDPVYYVTARYMRAIETMVRAAPHQYLWMHRRWKSRPRFEREGKPMPDSLRANLEDLPWMDPATMQRLQEPIALK